LFLSLKVGVAKTTNAVAVAEYLAEQGNRVLLVETDHQCGASAMLLGEDHLDRLEGGRRTLADLLLEAPDRDFDPDRIARYAVPGRSIRGLGDRLHVVPGSLRLEDIWTYFRPTESRDDLAGWRLRGDVDLIRLAAGGHRHPGLGQAGYLHLPPIGERDPIHPRGCYDLRHDRRGPFVRS
jgi:cellulose biosynthesis protein BcsQ